MFTSCKAMRDGWVGEGRWVRMLGGGGAGESGGNALTPKTCFCHVFTKHAHQTCLQNMLSFHVACKKY